MSSWGLWGPDEWRTGALFDPSDPHYFPGYTYGPGPEDEDDPTLPDLQNSWVIGEGMDRRKPHLQRGVTDGPARPDAPLTDTERHLQNMGHEFTQRIHQAEPTDDHLYRGMTVPPEWIDNAHRNRSISLPLSSFDYDPGTAGDYSIPHPDRSSSSRHGRGVVLRLDPGAKAMPLIDSEHVTHGDFDVHDVHPMTDQEDLEYGPFRDHERPTVIHVRQRSVPAPAQPRTSAIDRDVADDLMRLAMPAPLPDGMHFKPFERGDETSKLIQNTYPDINWEPGPGIAAHLPGNHVPVGHIEWLSDDDADEAEQYGEPKINPGEVSYINVDDDHRRHNIGTELFDQARAHEPRVHHSQDRTDLGNQWVQHEQSRVRTAMPNPLPQGVHFRYHPELQWSPGVNAHHNGKMIGSLDWYDDDHVMVDLGTRRPGEIDRINVHPDYQGNSVASSMFDFAKQHEPRLHHSDTLTEDGRGWSEYEKSRNARLAGRNGDAPPMTFEPFNTMWTNGIMARHADDGRPLAHLHWYPDGEIETIRVHPELRGRDIAKHVLAHAATHPENYEAEGGIKPSNHLTPEGRAFAQSLGHAPADDEVTPAEGENQWAWKAVDKYVPLHVPYTGQNEDEMSRYVEQPWEPPNRTASLEDEGWPVWWRNRHRPAGPFDKRWHPNHPDHIPAPWAN